MGRRGFRLRGLMSSPHQQSDPALGDVSALPLELLQTLEHLMERGGPFEASQPFEELTAAPQAEILARLRALHAPAPAEDLPVPMEADAQPTSAAQERPDIPAEPPLPAHATPARVLSAELQPPGRITEIVPQGVGPAVPGLQAQQEAPATSPAQRRAKQAEARGPAYTEGSDANSPYDPPPRTRQRTTAGPAQSPTAQSTRQLPQVHFRLTATRTRRIPVPAALHSILQAQKPRLS